MIILRFNDVSYESQGKTIVKGFTLDIEEGGFISIVGPSGSGKSTFLKLCCHLASPTGGNILYKGKDILEYDPIDLRKRIAYCFQMPYLFGDTVEDNINFPFAIRNQKADNGRVAELFSKFNLDGTFMKQEVKNLSGGEKQRIALIRTLLFKPEVLLLDEATSALDVENTAIVEKAICEQNREGTTILWITHNPEQSRRYANRLLTIENGEIRSYEKLSAAGPLAKTPGEENETAGILEEGSK